MLLFPISSSARASGWLFGGPKLSFQLRETRVAGFLSAWARVCPGDHWGRSSDTGVRVWRKPRPQGSRWTLLLCHIPSLLCHQQPRDVSYTSWCFFCISVLWLVYGSYSTELLIDCWQRSLCNLILALYFILIGKLYQGVAHFKYKVAH